MGDKEIKQLSKVIAKTMFEEPFQTMISEEECMKEVFALFGARLVLNYLGKDIENAD